MSMIKIKIKIKKLKLKLRLLIDYKRIDYIMIKPGFTISG